MKKIHISADTPLSALFHASCHDILRSAIDDLRSYLIADDATVDALTMNRFEFDFNKSDFGPCELYRRLTWMVINCPLCVPLSVFAKYMAEHSNLQAKADSIRRMIDEYSSDYQ